MPCGKAAPVCIYTPANGSPSLPGHAPILHRVRAAIFTSGMIDPILARTHADILENGIRRYKGNFVADLDSQDSDVVLSPKPTPCGL